MHGWRRGRYWSSCKALERARRIYLHHWTRTPRVGRESWDDRDAVRQSSVEASYDISWRNLRRFPPWKWITSGENARSLRVTPRIICIACKSHDSIPLSKFFSDITKHRSRLDRHARLIEDLLLIPRFSIFQKNTQAKSRFERCIHDVTQLNKRQNRRCGFFLLSPKLFLRILLEWL